MYDPCGIMRLKAFEIIGSGNQSHFVLDSAGLIRRRNYSFDTQ